MMATQPCSSCSEETAIGSVFYSDRRVVDLANGERAWLCVLCEGRIKAARRGAPLTDEEVRNLVANGTMAGIAWSRGVGSA
jgi:hypothetical protein